MFGRQAIRLIRKMWTNPMQLAREVYSLLVDDAAPLYHSGPITLQKPSGVDPYFTLQGHSDGDNIFNLTGVGGVETGNIGLYNGLLGTADSVRGLQAAVSATTTYLIHLRDEKTQNTNGGTFSNGGWRTRELTTKATDTGDLCTLVANQFTLPPGTYEIMARAPGYLVSRHQTRLQNITAGVTTKAGSCTSSDNSGLNSTDSHVWGIFSVVGNTVFELQHACSITRATNGFGLAVDAITEVYAEVLLRKLP